MSSVVQKEAFLYKQILTLLVVLAVITVSGCLGLLWMRQKIEMTAQATRQLEEEIVKEERRLQFLNNRIASIHQPHYLQKQIQKHQLDLRPPRADQIFYMDGIPDYRRAYARQDGEAEKPRERDPYRYSIDLAVMESLTPVD